MVQTSATDVNGQTRMVAFMPPAARFYAFFLSLLRSRHALHGGLYLAANVAAALVPFFLLPFLTRALSPDAYGSYSLFQMVSNAALPLTCWMVGTIIMREFALRQGDEFKRFFTCCLGFCLGLTLLLLVGSGIFSRPLSEALHLPWVWIAAGIFCAFVQALLVIVQNIVTMQRRPGIYLRWRLGAAIASGVLIYAAARFTGTWEAVGQAHVLFSLALCAILLLYLVRARMFLRPESAAKAQADIRLAVGYSTPLVVHAITTSFILQSADRLFVSHYLSIAEAGMYHVAQQLSMAMFVIITSMNQIWQPWFHERMKEDSPESRAAIVRATYLGFALLGMIGIMAIAALWLVFPYFIGAEFQDAKYLFPWLMLAGILNGMYVLVASPLFFFGDTRHIMWCNIGTGLLALALNALLVPIWGVNGAIAATMAATFFMFISIWVASALRHPYPWLACLSTKSAKSR